MLAGIQDVLVITIPEDKVSFERLLGDGSQLGVKLNSATQPSPDGLAQALIIDEEFIGTDPVCLVLGDNIFFGQGFSPRLKEISCQVMDPERFSVVEFDDNYKVLSIEDKPKKSK